MRFNDYSMNRMLRDLDELFEDSRSRTPGNICAACKSSRLLCGKSQCPIVVRYYSTLRIQSYLGDLRIEGSSPPSVFVGRFGWPKVMVGPMIPPLHGPTEILDTPELWIDKSIEEIVGFRSQLIRGKYRVHVDNVEGAGKVVDLTRELALCTASTDVEAEFTKKPAGRIVLDSEVQPYGPSGPIKDLDLSTLKIDRRIDKAYSDGDLKAQQAVLELYKNDVQVTKIQRAFSVGAFGLEKRRRFVPTRWSITAVDDIIGKALRERVKQYPSINEFRVYQSWRLDNRWMVLMMPYNWRYELIEAWYPNTVWNPKGKRIVMLSDHEGYEGRSAYAEIGGCYYAARLAVGEKLLKERRQAATVILREAHPGYIMPVGVWNVRENVRNALRGESRKFDTLREALYYISTKLAIPMSRWIKNSAVLSDLLYQRRIEDFYQVKT